ncbi:FUSC family protein [Chelatococcus sp. GCM10030263]|uniref:FUSC family protein n=1 Tax=Chelatococcus sp. GCM10030263 TaxID=3273387 RepID=UPI003617A314
MRTESSRDLVLLVAAAALGAISFLVFAPLLSGFGPAGPEVMLALGAFLVGHLKRFGILGGGLGSQVYIGQLLTYGTKLTTADIGLVAVAAVIAAIAAVVPRMLSGPAERPVTALTLSAAPRAGGRYFSPELVMGLQACVAGLVIVALNEMLGLVQSAWAITASTYVITNSALGTVDRARRRIIGTIIGVPLGIACLPIAAHAPLLIWTAAALAMVIYAMALPEHYEIACGAFAFTLVVTLAVTGEHSVALLFSRLWETLIGAGLGLVVATMIWPLRTIDDRRA